MTRDDARSATREVLRWVIVPEGARRSRSTGTPGYERDLIRDASGNLLGPTESRPADQEYRARFIAALAAELFAADEKRKLAAVEVADDALSPELRAALRESLERPASLLDEDKLALVVEFLGASRADSPYVLLPEDEAQRIQKELDTE